MKNHHKRRSSKREREDLIKRTKRGLAAKKASMPGICAGSHREKLNF